MKNHSQYPHYPLCTLAGMIRIIRPGFSQCSPLYHAVHLLNPGKIIHIMPFRVQTVKHTLKGTMYHAFQGTNCEAYPEGYDVSCPSGYICQKAFFKHALRRRRASEFAIYPNSLALLFLLTIYSIPCLPETGTPAGTGRFPPASGKCTAFRHNCQSFRKASSVCYRIVRTSSGW